MACPIAFLNGGYVPGHEAVLPVTDWGFLQGITIAEQLRTFAGRLFLREKHLARFQNGLKLLGWSLPVTEAALCEAIEHVVAHNANLLDAEDDLGVTLFMTPGTYPAYAEGPLAGPTLCVHTYPLPFQQWRDRYQSGVSLVTVTVRQVPSTCWPADLKCRSRMHYYLAQQEASQREPGSTALLLNQDGTVSETPTANLLAYFEGQGLVSPQAARILPGVSLHFLAEMAKRLGVPFVDRALTPQDLRQADELFVTSTPYCMLPVASLNGESFPAPGPTYAKLLAAWSAEVQIDIVQQAIRCGRTRPSSS